MSDEPSANFVPSKDYDVETKSNTPPLKPVKEKQSHSGTTGVRKNKRAQN